MEKQYAPRVGRHEWVKRVERWRDSGLTAKEYGAETGIHPGTLMAWSSRLRKEARQVEAPTEGARGPGASVSFLPISTQEADGPRQREAAPMFELQVRDIVLRIPVDFDDTALARLLRALEGAA